MNREEAITNFRLTLYSQLIKGAQENNNKNDDDLIFFEVENLTRSDLQKAGKKNVKVNCQDIALIYHKNTIHAVQESCPHSGGPLHLGDIEDLPEINDYCIRCPWHDWKFSLITGQCVSPTTRNTVFLKTFPVRLKGQIISLGFKQIHPGIFNQVPA